MQHFNKNTNKMIPPVLVDTNSILYNNNKHLELKSMGYIAYDLSLPSSEQDSRRLLRVKLAAQIDSDLFNYINLNSVITD